MIDLSFSDSELEERRSTIASFIEDSVAAAGANGAILGLSGGIDSSLTAALAVDALGTEGLQTVTMPAAVSDDRHLTDAIELADQLGLSCDVLEIEDIVEEMVQTVPTTIGERPRGNARARTRAVLSYLLANQDDLIVLGTGNRTEALIGYFTKYGDGAVDCHPIGNLYKCQVRQLARYVDVPDHIIDKTPTAELWADQTDEGELGIDYDTLDHILALHVDGPLSADATAATLGCERRLVEQVDGLVAASAHKRAVPPSP